MLPTKRKLRTLYGPAVFNAVFPLRKDFKEAIAARSPIHCVKPRSAAAGKLRAIVEEILARIPEARSRAPEFLHPEYRGDAGLWEAAS